MENIIKDAELNNYEIIMTEKDYFKINNYKLKKINYLKVSLEIPEKKRLLDKINSFND